MRKPFLRSKMWGKTYHWQKSSLNKKKLMRSLILDIGSKPKLKEINITY